MLIKHNDNLFIKTKEGDSSKLVKGRVDVNGGTIFINDTSVEISAGDEIHHVREGKDDNVYEVIYPGFSEGSSLLKAGYQVKVKFVNQ